MYVRISEKGTVLMVEDCYRAGVKYPLEELYHKNILPLFAEVPENIYPKPGWKYDGKTFTEPQLLEYIPELNIYYNPYPQNEAIAKVTREIALNQTSLALQFSQIVQEQTGILLHRT